jgi:hypothetical protein
VEGCLDYCLFCSGGVSVTHDYLKAGSLKWNKAMLLLVLRYCVWW